MSWPLLQNSLLVAGLTSLFSATLGFLAALWLISTKPVWQNRLLALAIIALVLPPFLVTNCWLHFLGLTGVWREWLPLNIYSLGGAVWILTLLTWPIVLLATLSAWRRLESPLLESDPALRGTALIRWLLWPMARNHVVLASVLTFVLALNNFAVPAILQVKVFPAEMWVRFSTNYFLTTEGKFDYVSAVQLTWPLILAPAVLLIVLRGVRIRWPSEQGPAGAQAVRRQLGRGWFWVSATMTIATMAFSVGLPIAQLLLARRTWIELPNVLHASPGLVWNSCSFAATAATACVVVGLATWRLPVGAFLWLPFLVPGVLLGIALIHVFNHRPLDWLYQSVGIVILAFTIRYLALGWNSVAFAMRSVDRDLTNAARLDGASGWSLLRHVHWPQIASQVGAAWYLVFLLCLWDVESLVLIVPPGGETLALRVFNLLHYGHNAQVNALCVLLLGLAVAPVAIRHLSRRVRAQISARLHP
jgi:iron(III) transport system permease protein